MCPVTVAAIVAAIVVLIVICCFCYSKSGPGGSGFRDRFWTQYGGEVPPDEQVRRVDAAEKGVPDMAWAEAYKPPNFCGARPPPVAGEPARPPFR